MGLEAVLEYSGKCRRQSGQRRPKGYRPRKGLELKTPVQAVLNTTKSAIWGGPIQGLDNSPISPVSSAVQN